jgi:methanogenic corrinoid protein MtbC1
MLEARGIGADALEEALRRVVDVTIAKMPELASEIPRLVDPALDAFRTPVAADDLAATDPRILPFMEAVLAGRRRDAMRLALEAAKASERFIDVYADLVQPTLYAIGHRWSCNQLSVAEEHAATAVTQQVVLRLYEEMPAATTRRGRALVACVEGERHQLGGHMVADALESDGWDTRFLGSDLPVSEVLREVVEQRPNLVGIGCTMPANLGGAIELIKGIHAKASSTHILVGGRAFLQAPGLAAELGALVGGDVREAVERAQACASA